MSVPEGPRAPFVFHADEAFVGEGALLRTPRRRAVTVVAVLVLVLLAVLVAQVPRMLAASSLDPVVNAHTGLADGDYVLEPTASMHDADRCWFRGPIRGLPAAGEVTVAGQGALECAGEQDYVGRVSFTVHDGRADIVRAGGY